MPGCRAGRELDNFLEDRPLYNHCLRVANNAVSLASVLGLTEEQQKIIYFAGLLHDLGKVKVGKSILQKPYALTVQERWIIEKHPRWGVNILQGTGFLQPVLPLILHHHERFDGTGYPARLAGNVIPFGARILSIADVFDAMTFPRTYRKMLSTEEALEELRRCSGKQFDPLVVEAFVESRSPELELTDQYLEYQINVNRIIRMIKDG